MKKIEKKETMTALKALKAEIVWTSLNKIGSRVEGDHEELGPSEPGGDL